MIQFGDDNGKLNLQFEEEIDPTPGACIKVVGVGGGGGNAIDRMIESGINGVDFIAANTDAQALRRSKAPVKVQIGAKVTKGLGAGSKPEVGREAALEDTNSILEHLDGADMVFVTAGLGGGTGTGAAPIIASLASELGSLVVAVVTTPFGFEGPRRRRNANSGLQELKGSVDTVITISNDKLLKTVPDSTPFTEAFRIADDVLRQAVQGISDLINQPGIINLDFADVKTIMSGMGVALMGSGTATGESRAVEAAQMAVSSPLLEDATINGARGVLLNIVGGPDMTMNEINEAATLIQQACDPEAEIIFGSVTDEKSSGSITVTVIATGFSTPSRELEEQNAAANVQAFPSERRYEQPAPTREMRQGTYGREERPEHHERRGRDEIRRDRSEQFARKERKESAGRQERDEQFVRPGGRRLEPEAPAERPPVRHNRQERPAARQQQADRQPRPSTRDLTDRRLVARDNLGYDDHPIHLDERQPLHPRQAADFATPDETVKEVLMTPQSYGANNMGFDDENDLDIPTYLRNMRKMKK
ncbi:MAG: cell division protein FtsZ [Acidobacteriota bacterium]|nr:cell division protein FtsZ [Acidobacteriota bacterium]